jgi:hypothetical protein
VRDLDFDQDRSPIRTASGPQIMASLRNLATTLLRLTGATCIAAAPLHHTRRPSRPLRTIMKVLIRLCRRPGAQGNLLISSRYGRGLFAVSLTRWRTEG